MAKLETGQYVILREAIPETNLERLRRIAERLVNTKSRPIYIADETLLGKDIIERYKSAGITEILKQASPWIKAMIGDSWLILANKTLLRRTWPLSEKKARQLGHNASNLTWHQDSNAKHGNNPMVVIMVVLQNGAGITRPSLSILETPTNHFEGVFGYEGSRVDEFEEKIRQKHGQLRISTPLLNSGDLLIFNGLTFHRTYSDEWMNSHRDALLIRIIRPNDANNFPKGQHITIKKA